METQYWLFVMIHPKNKCLEQNGLFSLPILYISNNFSSLEISFIFRKILRPQNEEEMKNESADNIWNIKPPDPHVGKHLGLGELVF